MCNFHADVENRISLQDSYKLSERVANIQFEAPRE
jgi:hypothetical protein